MSSSQIFKSIKIDKIHINRKIFEQYLELYEIFNKQVRGVDVKASKEMIKVLEDVCVMAVKMNKKIIEYKNKKSNKELNETIKLSRNILKKFENK